MNAWQRAARQRAHFLPALGGLPAARSLNFPHHAARIGRVADQRSPAAACGLAIIQDRTRYSYRVPGRCLGGRPEAGPKHKKCVATRQWSREPHQNRCGMEAAARLRACGSRHGHMNHDLSPTGLLAPCCNARRTAFFKYFARLTGGLVTRRLPPLRL